MRAARGSASFTTRGRPWAWTERLAARFLECEAIVYGHTHLAEIRRLGTRLIVNPGSPTAPRGFAQPTLLALKVADGKIEPEVIAP